MARSSGISSRALDSRSSAMRESGGGWGASRADKLLGLSSSVHNSHLEPDGVDELDEEDVWETEARGLSEERTEAPGRSVGHGHNVDNSDSFRLYNSGRRWLGIEKDPGLPAAFADGTRTLGLSALSPHKFGGMGNVAQQSLSREGTPSRISAAARMIPPTGHLRESTGRQAMHQSAPVNVPDWSKILGGEKKSKWQADDSSDGDKDDVDEERLPPHLQIARECAQSQMTTFSVCEGAGRTLKGRDLSRVRNAVLRQTGFLDS